jgi:hypothetical protein
MRTEKIKTSGLDMAGLLALKAFERPDADRIEKNIQNTLRAVRTAHKRPSLHFFPDKSTAWMFAQPRYGIAALFVLFLGLHLMQRPMPAETVGSAVVQEPVLGEVVSAAVATNDSPAFIPPVPTGLRPNYSSLIQPVSFTE